MSDDAKQYEATPAMTNAAFLRHLAAHPYRDEIVAFLTRQAFGWAGVKWRWTLLDIAHELEARP